MKGGPTTLKAAKSKLTRRKNEAKKADREVFELREALKIAVESARRAKKNQEDAEFELEVLKRKTNVEEIFWRFPHLGKYILDELDDESLVKCREVNKWWQDFVNGQRTSYVRNITKCFGLSKMPLQKKLQKESLEMLKELSHFANRYYTAEYEGPQRKSLILLDLLNEGYYTDLEKSITFYLCELIIDNSDDKNPVDQYGYSMLHTAAMDDNPKIYQMVMTKNKDKNPMNPKYRNTPLHEAARNNHIEVCKVILNGVKEWNPKDLWGETPYDIAKKLDHKDICELFEPAHPKQRGNKKRRVE